MNDQTSGLKSLNCLKETFVLFLECCVRVKAVKASCENNGIGGFITS